MAQEEIVVKFAHSLEKFEPISGQPSDSDLTIIREVVAPLLLQIPYDETGAVHNLISLIRPEAAYITRYGAAFPEPTRVGAYDPQSTTTLCPSSAHAQKRRKRRSAPTV